MICISCQKILSNKQKKEQQTQEQPQEQQQEQQEQKWDNIIKEYQLDKENKIYLDFLDQVMIRYPITISEDGTISKEAVRDPLVEKTSPLFEELWNFCTILNKKMNGEPFENQSAENLLTTKLCVLALDSAHKDETIKLGGQKMNLENNSEKEDLSVEPCSNIKKKVIMVTGCGGAPTINFVRSLRDADPKREKYHIIGIDANQHTIHRNECDKAYLCPRVDDEKYIPFVKN